MTLGPFLIANVAGSTADQEMGIDLPLKALIYQDGEGKVWLAYNDPGWLAARHHLPGQPAIAALSKLLETLAKAATAA